MKKIAYILSCLLLFAGCNEKPTPEPPVEEVALGEKVIGEWHCTLSDIEADIYLWLMEDQAFELYQKIGDGRYCLYKGTWSADNATGVLSGKYNDGSLWGSSYKATVSEDNEHMSLTPEKDASKEQVYQRCTIPTEIKDSCVIIVKSSGDDIPAAL